MSQRQGEIRLCYPVSASRSASPVRALFQYEDLVCFRDIRPGAPHHYLVVPVEHMGNCKTLKSEHIPIGKAAAWNLGEHRFPQA